MPYGFSHIGATGFGMCPADMQKGTGVEQEWMVAAVVIAVLSPLFGHFEAKAPMWMRMAR